MRRLAIACVVLIIGIAPSVTGSQAAKPCEVTKPNGVMAGSQQTAPKNVVSYGNQQISVGPFGLWPDGIVVFRPGGPGFITPDGSLGMKFGWTLGVRGPLAITGRRLDAPAPALRAVVNPSNSPANFVASDLVFSTPGCWEVTGHVGSASVTFVTMVTKVGDGPSWRKDVGRF
jgi:hypothetical protein